MSNQLTCIKGEQIPCAAVLIMLAGEGSDQRLLLTQRSARLSSHAGEVAFPGGKKEPGDANLQETALREAHEEVGLHAQSATIVRQLPVSFTRLGIAVTPFVATVPDNLTLVPCAYEVESMFWVPVKWLLSDPRKKTHLLRVDNEIYWSPVYAFSGYTIWGLTARLLVEFMNQHCGADITREHSAPEELFTTR